MKRLSSWALAALLVAACGGAAPTPDVSQRASDYASQEMGVSEPPLGCSGAAPGRESENHPGCIWSVLFAGCHDGLTGGQLSPLTVEEEFPTEPALQARYHQAVSDCAALR